MRTIVLVFSAFIFATACLGAGAVYPPRPPATPGEAIADPAPSRVVLHTTITSAGMTRAMNENVPETGEGTFPLLGRERRFTWKRGAVAIRFGQGKVSLGLRVDVHADMPVGSLEFPLDFRISAEPVITSDYVAKLQSLDVQVDAPGRLLRAADAVGNVLETIKNEVEHRLVAFGYDLRPALGAAFERVAKPIEFPMGDARGCASVKVLALEAGPTVMADGFEKDLALVIAPSVTVPCASDASIVSAATLPPLANVAAIQPGPFTVTVPIAAKYDELAKAMSLAFTDGKLFFSKEMPAIYLDQPEVYASADQIVLKLHLGGPIDKPVSMILDGDLFLTGHPAVHDNELTVPDLTPTVETGSFLLKLKAAMDADAIRDEARAALKVDLSERLRSVKEKLSTDLVLGDGQGCVRAAADKIEVTGVHLHQAYLRVYVALTAHANVYVPCPG